MKKKNQRFTFSDMRYPFNGVRYVCPMKGCHWSIDGDEKTEWTIIDELINHLIDRHKQFIVDIHLQI